MSDLSAVLSEEFVNRLKSEPQLLSGVPGFEKMSTQDLETVVTTLQPILEVILRDSIAKLKLRQIQITGTGYVVTTADKRTIQLQLGKNRPDASLVAAAAVGMTGGNTGSDIKQITTGSMASTK